MTPFLKDFIVLIENAQSNRQSIGYNERISISFGLKFAQGNVVDSIVNNLNQNESIFTKGFIQGIITDDIETNSKILYH